MTDLDRIKRKVRKKIKELKNLLELIEDFRGLGNNDVEELMLACSDLQYITGVCVPSIDFDVNEICKYIDTGYKQLLEEE